MFGEELEKEMKIVGPVLVDTIATLIEKGVNTPGTIESSNVK